MNSSQIEAVEVADAHANNASLPPYSALFALVQRLAYPDAGELLILDDFRNIARNIFQPDGVKIEDSQGQGTPKLASTVPDQTLRTLWTDAGGRFHGPRVETGTMPEAQLLPFLRSLMGGAA